jgi:hypothetical protein
VTWLLAIFSKIFWISARACFTCACPSRRVRVSDGESGGRSAVERRSIEPRERVCCLGAYRDVAADGGQEICLRGVPGDACHFEPLHLARHRVFFSLG